MSQSCRHCPFLNRADARCARHFTLDALQHAYEYCFDHYKACPTYIELLVERRVRRLETRVVRQTHPVLRRAEPAFATVSAASGD
jgi:hypothetical protein